MKLSFLRDPMGLRAGLAWRRDRRPRERHFESV
jgi:hypothetical protein